MKKVIVFTSSHLSWSLISLLIETKRLVAVVVTPNNHPQFFEMVKFIQENKINVYQQPEELKDDFIDILKNLDGDIALSLFYSTLFPKKIVSIFNDGIFNIHPSALPKYRGPHPLYWQIRDGERDSALSIHTISEDIDSGDIVGSIDFGIDKYDTIGSLLNKVVILVPQLIMEFFNKLETNTLKYIKQENSTYYETPTNRDFEVDWKKDSAFDISQKAKSSNPIYGGIETIIKNSSIKILEATPVNNQTYGVKEGVIILIDEKDGLVVATKNNTSIRLDVVSTMDGVFSGYSFANHQKLFSGEQFKNR